MQPFVIPLAGLKAGSSHFEWRADGRFFGTFENSDILDADIVVNVDVLNEESSVSVSGTIEGSVVVICDRCLERLSIDIDTEFEDDDFDDCLKEIDLSQDVYDFVCTSLPITRVHEEGGCNPETVKYLNK